MNPSLIKLSIIIILIFGSEKISAQVGDWGVGIRGGDPTGITVKRYFNNSAIEGIIGYPTTWFYDNRERQISHRHGDRYYFGDYRGTSGAVSLQLRYLRDMTLESGQVPGLVLYYGAGLFFRTITYNYDYYDSNTQRFYYDETIRTYGLGPEAVFGTEYTFEELPLSAFLEASLYIEIAGVFHLEPLMGLGARFNF